MEYMVKNHWKTSQNNSQALPLVQLHLWIQEDQGLPRYGKKEDSHNNE